MSLFALGGLSVLPAGAQGNPQVTAHRMSGGPIPNNCEAPVARTAFAPTDARAFQWTFFSGIRIGDVLKWEFVQPSGAIYLTRQEASPYAGNVCGWESVDIAGQAAASLPGAWQVRVFLNNALMVTDSFTIGGATPPTVGAAVIIDGTDANDHGAVSGGKNSRGWLYMQKALESLSVLVSSGTAKVVVDLGTTSGDARRAIDSAFNLSTLKNAGWTIVHVDGAANINSWLANLSTANTGILYLPTYNLITGDLEREELDAINAQAGRIAAYVNRESGNGGSLFAMGETNLGSETRAWGWLRSLFPALNFADEAVGTDLRLTPDGIAAFPGLSDPDLDLSNGEYWHNYFTGDLGTLKVLATAPDRNNVTRNVIIGGIGIVFQPPSCLAIGSLSPASAAPGASVTITGNNFSGVNAVKFANNVAANFTVNNNTQIVATVPAGAVSGPVTISKPGCPDAQVAFTVITDTRRIRVGCGSGSPGGPLILPIELVSRGDENAVGFSINFDPSILSLTAVARGADASAALINTNTSQLAQGRLGIALALPSGQVFATGTRQLATITFTIAANTTATTTAVTFGDAPIRRQFANANAVALTGDFQGCGNIPITPDGYEADVTPRPTGKKDGSISINDWVMVGRFAAGLDAAAAGSEFQRGDCAPRASRGDGYIDITDWVQAGRYAASLDPVVTAGGPSAPALAIAGRGNESAMRAEAALHGRDIRVLNALLPRGQTGAVAVEIDAEGIENAIGFTLTFDPNALAFVSAAADPTLGNALVNVNATMAAQGRVGIAMALGAGEKLKAGKQTILLVRFTALGSGSAVTIEVGFGDQPIRRQVVDVNAGTVDAHFTAGTVTLSAVNPVASVSAASFKADAAPESIMAAFGASLATAVQVASQTPLPTSLAGTTVTVRDSAGTERLAPLFFVAPSQVNYLLPAGSAAGPAAVTIKSGDGAISAGTVTIAGVAPSLFTANANGQGVAAAVLLRVKADGSQVYEAVARFDAAQNRFVPVAIAPGPESDQLFLILYGTGLRHRSALSGVSATAGNLPAETLFAGAVDDFAGLDQLNLRLPRGLAGRAVVDVIVTADGRTANAVQIAFGN